MPLLVGVLGKLELFFAGDQDGSVVDQPWTELPDTAVALFLASSRFNRFSSRFARYLACSAFCFLTLSWRSLASALSYMNLNSAGRSTSNNMIPI